MSRKVILVLLILFVIILAWQETSQAATSWEKVVDKIEGILRQSLNTYRQGDAEKARGLVNEAYFGFFEKEGLERAILSKHSSNRAALLEYKFSNIKKLMGNQVPVPEVEQAITELTGMLREDAARLDGPQQQNPLENFLSSFLILVREGFEAILILGAIVAYLVKSGNQRRIPTIYYSAGLAVLASIVTAIVLQLVLRLSGASNEILEGATMLLAAIVLFAVSHWMVGKAEAKSWQRYIEDKVQGSLSSGSALALGAAAFLAVYREGAETVLFYQALLNNAAGAAGLVWLGFAAGILALAAIFLLVRYGSLKIPLKPFFLGTSLLLYYLAFVFAGDGVKALQEAGVAGATPVPGLPAIDFLGIYPTWETLLPQFILLAAAALGVICQRRQALAGRSGHTPSANP
ncbi:Iron permease FTR1 [Moorella glycerini]|uniref:Ferrous iron permease EfeU n=1 Tax=Neomoorella stamsii TaxID=1266720 RepID=A0A9X7J023_9FIRM|nr:MULTISPECIES: FTR1 family protein [Moorella]PRR68885.1 Ferrous iron permease EfeU precursor [Moorella stamsii]CEP67506.1 Iron permease FTR1 [Moorella glycerini]